MSRFNIFNREENKDKNPKEEKIQEKFENLKEVFEEAKEESKYQLKDAEEEDAEIAKEEAIRYTANAAAKIFEEHPDVAIEICKKIRTNDDLPNEIVTETIMNLLDKNKEKMAVKAVEEIDLPPQAVAYIARESDMSYEAAKRVVEQIGDEELQDEETKRLKTEQEKSIIQDLKKIENKCTNLEIHELIEQLKEIEMPFITEKIQKEIDYIIVKVTAFNCMKYGGPRLDNLFQFFSAEDMLEKNFQQMLRKEYVAMKKEFEEKDIEFVAMGRSNANDGHAKYREYKSEDLKRIILEKIAEHVAKNIDDVGEIIVPQSEQITNLTPEEEKIFIDSIIRFSKQEIGENDIIKIKRQMKGEHTTGVEDLINMLGKLPRQKRDVYVESFVEQINAGRIKNKQEDELTNAVAKFLKQIDGMSNNEAIKTVNAITETLEERKQARNLINRVKQTKDNSHESSVGETR